MLNSLCSSCTESERPLTFINPRNKSGSRHYPTLPSSKRTQSSFLDDKMTTRMDFKSKSSTLPGNHHSPSSSPHQLAPNQTLPGYPYRPPSPILLSDPSGDTNVTMVPTAKASSSSSKRSLFRRRAESVDSSKTKI